MTCHFSPCIFPGRPWKRSPKISTVPDRWSRCLCGLDGVYSPSLSQRSDYPFYHPVSRDQASFPAESSGLAHRVKGYQAALTSQPSIWYQQLGIGKEQLHRALWTALYASRNDRTFWEGSAANSPIPDSPLRLHMYNRTRRLPPEVEADPLACFLQNHRVWSTAT